MSIMQINSMPRFTGRKDSTHNGDSKRTHSHPLKTFARTAVLAGALAASAGCGGADETAVNTTDTVAMSTQEITPERQNQLDCESDAVKNLYNAFQTWDDNSSKGISQREVKKYGADYQKKIDVKYGKGSDKSICAANALNALHSRLPDLAENGTGLTRTDLNKIMTAQTKGGITIDEMADTKKQIGCELKLVNNLNTYFDTYDYDRSRALSKTSELTNAFNTITRETTARYGADSQEVACANDAMDTLYNRFGDLTTDPKAGLTEEDLFRISSKQEQEWKTLDKIADEKRNPILECESELLAAISTKLPQYDADDADRTGGFSKEEFNKRLGPDIQKEMALKYGAGTTKGICMNDALKSLKGGYDDLMTSRCGGLSAGDISDLVSKQAERLKIDELAIDNRYDKKQAERQFAWNMFRDFDKYDYTDHNGALSPQELSVFYMNNDTNTASKYGGDSKEYKFMYGAANDFSCRVGDLVADPYLGVTKADINHIFERQNQGVIFDEIAREKN